MVLFKFKFNRYRPFTVYVLIDRPKQGLYFDLRVRYFVCVSLSVSLSLDYSHTLLMTVNTFGVKVLFTKEVRSKCRDFKSPLPRF